ncbi:uncharacterized protein PgNI_08229 [Pyricularia grisea]|uniref:Uncharacterized protein n=1 Tax=Pyricularia grisea TaxID=148305 RepID=A0A6P8AU97_PYRGI|nr:uncharacterized protein PgNI_08229 [Pyricularia grisea]TLD05782.1 hypothetical protein PgNI_08229 [Pyricularia grisea]
MTSPQTLHLIPVWSVCAIPFIHRPKEDCIHEHTHAQDIPRILISWESSASWFPKKASSVDIYY